VTVTGAWSVRRRPRASGGWPDAPSWTGWDTRSSRPLRNTSTPSPTPTSATSTPSPASPTPPHAHGAPVSMARQPGMHQNPCLFAAHALWPRGGHLHRRRMTCWASTAGTRAPASGSPTTCTTSAPWSRSPPRRTGPSATRTRPSCCPARPPAAATSANTSRREDPLAPDRGPSREARALLRASRSCGNVAVRVRRPKVDTGGSIREAPTNDDGTDPRFEYCYQAKEAGDGPYYLARTRVRLVHRQRQPRRRLRVADGLRTCRRTRGMRGTPSRATRRRPDFLAALASLHCAGRVRKEDFIAATTLDSWDPLMDDPER
jgi:hypothetical protein